MRILTKFLPTPHLMARLSCKYNNRRYNSLVQVIRHKSSRDQHYSDRHLIDKKVYGTRKGIAKDNDNVILNKKETSSSLSAALSDLNHLLENVQSHQVPKQKVAEGNTNFQAINKDLNSQNREINSLSQNTLPVSRKAVPNLAVNQIYWNKHMPFCVVKHSFVNSFPLKFSEKSFSTNAKVLRQTAFSTAGTLSKSSIQKCISVTTQRTASNECTSSNLNPNYDYPFLSKLFDTENFLMNSDAYKQSLVEADKRRAALKECNALSHKLKTDNERPKVTFINVAEKKVHDALCKNTCPPPAKPKKTAADGGCKKDDPCKPKECPDPCKEVLEKQQKIEEMGKKKKNKLPTGCESPKCKRDDCNKPPKSPCKTSTNQKSTEAVQTLQSHSETIKIINKTSKDCACSYCKMTKEVDNKFVSQQATKFNADCSVMAKDKKPNPCTEETKEYKPKCNEDPCKPAKPSTGEGNKPSATKSDAPCKRKDSKDPKDPNNPNKSNDSKDPKDPKDPCKKQKEDRNPCKRRGETMIHKDDPCASKVKDPCRGRKTRYSETKIEDQTKKQQKDDAPKKDKADSSQKPKDDPCKKKKEDEKQDPCKKEKKNPCETTKKEKEDPCKKKKEKIQDKSEKPDACKKEIKKEKENPCESSKNKEKESSSPCKFTTDVKATVEKSSSTNCNSTQPRRETKPNCGKTKKSFSTLAAPTKITLKKRETKPNCGKNKRCFSLLASPTLPSPKMRKFYNFNYVRYFSSRRSDKNKDGSADLGKSSQCKSVETRIPPHRTPVYNPHPKEGLRQCYPTYDMDCRKLCKDARKTACEKYSYLRDTEHNERKSKK